MSKIHLSRGTKNFPIPPWANINYIFIVGNEFEQKNEKKINERTSKDDGIFVTREKVENG